MPPNDCVALKEKRKLVVVAHPSELVPRGRKDMVRAQAGCKQDDSQDRILNLSKYVLLPEQVYDEYGPIATCFDGITACCLLFSEP